MIPLLPLAICIGASQLVFAQVLETPNSFPGSSAPSGCGRPLPEGQAIGGVYNVTIPSSEVKRSYLVFIPQDYSPYSLTPSILSYHGGNRNASSQLELDELTSPEFNTKSIVVYPQGINETWQGVPGVTTDDVKFTEDILNEVHSLYCIDPSRISATGKSDGGGFCNVLACDLELSQRISAFAPVSGAYYVDWLPCNSSTVPIPCSTGRKDIPMLAFHGGNDSTISYSGGERKKECLPSIPHFVQQWAVRDNLGITNVTTPLEEDTVTYAFGHGKDAGLVELIYESNIGHDWPSTAPNADNSVAGHHVANYDATPIILDFFQSHPLSIKEASEEIL